jgi:hypothetical protein
MHHWEQLGNGTGGPGVLSLQDEEETNLSMLAPKLRSMVPSVPSIATHLSSAIPCATIYLSAIPR